MPLLVCTVGHSTRSADEFVALLQRFSVKHVADVRTVPRSAHNPQFSAERLAETLGAADIGYTHHAGLGGFRKPAADSPNGGWHNERFRGYADHMQTPEFAEALARLCEQAGSALTAVMCAEGVPWRCHRSLIADALTVRGVEVRHIVGATEPRRHTLTRFAEVAGTGITYPHD